MILTLCVLLLAMLAALSRVLPATRPQLSFLDAMRIGVAAMPTNVFQVCRRGIGNLGIDPWRLTSSAGDAVRATVSWFRALFSPEAAIVAGAVLLALLASDLSTGHGVVLANGALIGLSLPQLQERRASLVREAESLQQTDGSFESDEKRAQFDAKMTEVGQVDARMRELQATPPAPAETDATRAAREAGATAERKRAKDIRDAVRIAGLEASVAEDMVSRGVTIETARAEIFARLEARSAETATSQHVRVGEDAQDKWRRGVESWLLIRSGAAAMVAKFQGTTPDKIDAGEFRGLSLLDIAKDTLTRANASWRA
jgi:hypothetical protein